MRRQSFDAGQVFDIACDVLQRRFVVLDHAAAAEEMVGGEARGPAGGAAGGQYMRGPRSVIAQRDRAVVPQKRGARVANLLEQVRRVVRRNVQELRRDQVHHEL